MFLKDIIPCFRLLIATGVVLFHKPSQTSPNCPCPSLRTNFKLFLSISHWSFVEWDRSAVTGFSICKKKYEKWKYEKYSFCTKVPALKVAFIQKGLMPLSFLQTDKPNYFPELEFDFFFHSKWLKSCQIRTWSCSNAFSEHSKQLHVLIWHDLSHLEWTKIKILAQENN